MPCYEYHPKRFWVEMDEREFMQFINACEHLLKENGFTQYAKDLWNDPSLRGLCIGILVQLYEGRREVHGLSSYLYHIHQ